MTKHTDVNLNSQFSIDDLLFIIENQVTLAQKGDIAQVEKLTQNADTLIEKIKLSGTLDLKKNNRQLQDLVTSYNKLILILTAQKDAARQQLNSINRGKKTFKAYSSNVLD
jgi:hypothetical protein